MQLCARIPQLAMRLKARFLSPLAKGLLAQTVGLRSRPALQHALFPFRKAASAALEVTLIAASAAASILDMIVATAK